MGFLAVPDVDPEWLEQNRTHMLHLAALQMHMDTKTYPYFTIDQLFELTKEMSGDLIFRRAFITPKRLKEAEVRMLNDRLCTIR